MIEFYLDGRSGVATYLQLVQQIRRAVRLGRLKPGDQLPTVRQVVAKLAINPNTVLKAYRELEHEGLVRSRPGAGTYVRPDARPSVSATQSGLRLGLARWMHKGRQAGLGQEDLRALFEDLMRDVEGDSAEGAV